MGIETDWRYQMSLNVVTLVGRVGGDPDIKYYESGTVKCRLTLAVDRRSRRTDKPDWFNLDLWGKTAEIASNYVRKGSLIGVKGELRINTWSDRDTGADRSSPVISVDDLDLLGSRRDNEAGNVPDNYDEF